jgi:hypothetical protein
MYYNYFMNFLDFNEFIRFEEVLGQNRINHMSVALIMAKFVSNLDDISYVYY